MSTGKYHKINDVIIIPLSGMVCIHQIDEENEILWGKRVFTYEKELKTWLYKIDTGEVTKSIGKDRVTVYPHQGDTDDFFILNKTQLQELVKILKDIGIKEVRDHEDRFSR